MTVPKDKALDALAARLHGPLLEPGDAGYEPARRIWNAMIDRRPAAIARCSGAADVEDCVDFARETGMSLSVRGGGHNIAGTSLADGGLVVDLSGLRGVHVDPATRRVRVQPGATLADLDRETQAHGLVVPSGIVSETGVAGLTLAGGFGWLSRKWGYTCDHLISADVVTAAGEHVRASADDNDDLFWGLKGGSGNFGVVTSFEFAARVLGPEVTAGIIVHPFAAAREVIGLYRELAASASDELSLLLVLRKAPPAPYLPQAVHGQPIAALALCHAGERAAAEREVAPIKAFGSPHADTVGSKPFRAHQKLLDAGQPKGRHYYWKSDYVADLPPDLDDVLIGAAEALTSPHSAILVMQLGGAARRVGEDESAVGLREAGHVVNFSGSWEGGSPEAHVAWAREAFDALQPFSMGGGYLNFLTEDDLAGDGLRVRRAYGAQQHARLGRLKARWDPDNLFRNNHNIAPAERSARAPRRATSP